MYTLHFRNSETPRLNFLLNMYYGILSLSVLTYSKNQNLNVFIYKGKNGGESPCTMRYTRFNPIFDQWPQNR